MCFTFSRLACLFLFFVLWTGQAAFSIESFRISIDDKALDLTPSIEILPYQGKHLQLSTAPSQDGVVQRIEVEANDTKSHGWAVFALTNSTDQQIDRLIIIPHYRLVNSGLFWPDLGESRISTITPSEGFALDRQNDHNADVFHLTLNPRATVTFVAELSSPSLPKLYLWNPDTYKSAINAYTLFRGIVIGISGLLALFFTILSVVRGTSIFPACAALSWSVLAYICVDFGFLDKIIHISLVREPVWRAFTEVSLSAALMIFLFTYLNLNRWHAHFNYVIMAWLLGLIVMAGIAFYSPPLAAFVARVSFFATGLSGVCLIVFLSFQGYDRAIMLIPGWVMILLWILASGMTISGSIDNDIVQSALSGGLVLVVLLVGFTVIQHAFTGGFLQQGLFSDMERRALSLSGSGNILWDWDVIHDRIITEPDVSSQLHLPPKSLSGPVRNWLPALHAEDRDIFRSLLEMIIQHGRGQISHDFRLRSGDGHYYWFSLRARPVVGASGETIRCVGTMTDVTHQKKSESRLLHDAFHDSLTGLPNRQLFMSCVDCCISISKINGAIQPTLFVIDIDRFKEINNQLGISSGDTILLTLARRLKRFLKSDNFLCRFSANRFGLLLISDNDPIKIAKLSNSIAETIQQPINFAKQEFSLTASIGFVNWTKSYTQASDMLRDAELAMYQAKRSGGKGIEAFRAAFRLVGTDSLQLESDLKQALENKTFSLSYQPIIDLQDGHIVGFNAIPLWKHPLHGSLLPSEFIPASEMSDLIFHLGFFIMENAAKDLSLWQKRFPKRPLFVWVDLPSAQLIRPDLISDIRTILIHTNVKPSGLRLGFSEAILMDNPEQSLSILSNLKKLGIYISLNDFGSECFSFSYFSRFSFDSIRIDSDFPGKEVLEPDIILKGTINMLHELNISVVAKNFTPNPDLAQLKKTGFQYMQTSIINSSVNSDSVLQLLADTSHGSYQKI